MPGCFLRDGGVDRRFSRGQGWVRGSRRDAARDGSTSRRFPRFALGSLARPARRSDAKPPSNEVRLFAGVLVGTKRREEVRFLVVT
ncbi:hypothetical protein BDA96_05G071200 [Sorghum bicolor]|uniref:Uncharacterized protein n=1 Tax=Sorghum bicolor TaxID=4558 RepID=A0A921UFZ4_SORBI|nr:hypothetical protein BDA96_05G071200 [Sorghum bicolor]